MFCPSCSTQAVDGAKFCKSCGMNLSVISQALSGGVVGSDPVRDREYKRARKQISDGIQGMAIGAAFLVAAALTHLLLERNTALYLLTLLLALIGVIYLFRSIGRILDAKVGPSLLDPALQPRGTGGLAGNQAAQPAPTSARPSQHLNTGSGRLPSTPASETRPVSLEERNSVPSDRLQPPRVGTGRVNREHSSPLRRLDKDDDVISRLRN